MAKSDVARARDRLRYAKKTGKAPRPEDVELVRASRARGRGRPPKSIPGVTTAPDAPDVGPEVSTHVPPPSSTETSRETYEIPTAPAPDLGAPPDPAASGEGSPTGDPTGSNASESDARSGGAPTSAGNAAGGQALAVMYGHALRGMNAAAKERKLLITFPEPMIDALEQAAAVVFAPYGDKIKPEYMVLAAPTILGAQLAIHEVKNRKKEKARQTPSPFASPIAEQTAAQDDAVPESPPPPPPPVIQADPPARAARTAADFFAGPT